MTSKAAWIIPFMMLLLVIAVLGFVIMKMRREASGQLARSQEEGLAFPGFTVAELPPPGVGLVVTSLRSDSEAQRDGVRVGDRILAIDGRAVPTIRAAATEIRADPDDVISLQLSHNHGAYTITLDTRERHIHGA